MSTPGGPYWQEQPPQYQVDPITGQPQPYPQAQYQQPQQQYGGYQGFGMYQPEPPKKSNAPLIIGIVVALLLAGGGVTTWLLLKDDKKEQPISGPASSSSNPPATTTTAKSSKAPTTAKKPTTSKTPTEVEEILIDSVTPGFQGVLSYKEKVAYDVPSDWKVRTPGTIVGYEDNAGKPVVVMHGVSTYRPEACTGVNGSHRGHVGWVTAPPDVDPQRAATNGVKLFADAGALNKDNTKAPVAYGETKPTKVNQGKTDAFVATATLTVNQPGECSSPTVLYTAVSFKNGDSTVLFMSYMDQGTPDSLTAETMQQVIASLRPYTG